MLAVFIWRTRLVRLVALMRFSNVESVGREAVESLLVLL